MSAAINVTKILFTVCFVVLIILATVGVFRLDYFLPGWVIVQSPADDPSAICLAILRMGPSIGGPLLFYYDSNAFEDLPGTIRTSFTSEVDACANGIAFNPFALIIDILIFYAILRLVRMIETYVHGRTHKSIQS